MSNNRQLFVYGSLRNGFNHLAHQFISRYFNMLGNAKIKGKLYDLGEYPAAIPDNGDFFIVGELYAIKLEDEYSYAIAQIDDYEGIAPEEGEALYRREIVTVFTDAGEQTEAWVYWYNGSVENAPLVESGDVLQYLWQKQA